MCADWLTVAKEQESGGMVGSQRGSGGVENLSAVAHCRDLVGTHRCLKKREKEELDECRDGMGTGM